MRREKVTEKAEMFFFSQKLVIKEHKFTVNDFRLLRFPASSESVKGIRSNKN